MKDMNALYNVYKNADRNGNGVITKDELARAFGLHPADQEKIYLMMSSMDSDSNGIVDFSEFVNWGS
jgi:Ca2+-binding EF-hand superfamily protein